MNWSKWIRQIHRWLSMTFTAAVIANILVLAQGPYIDWVGYMAVVPLFLLLGTGLYLFALPYAAKWRSGRRAGAAE